MASIQFAPRPCSKCGVVYAEDGYRASPRYRDGYTRRCRKCHDQAANEARQRRIEAAGGDWRALYDLENRRAYYAKWRSNNRAKLAANQRRFKYGISDEDFEKLLQSSGGMCAICQTEMGVPRVDHCHTTGRVRGLLCHNCNVGIGNLRDDPNLLRAAADYLERT